VSKVHDCSSLQCVAEKAGDVHSASDRIDGEEACGACGFCVYSRGRVAKAAVTKEISFEDFQTIPTTVQSRRAASRDKVAATTDASHRW
jgi:hypothetical protein